MRQRCLICAYDSPPILERLIPLLTKLKQHYEPIVFVQFPETQKRLEYFGYETFLYRSVIGWEHGNFKAIKRRDTPEPHRSYESALHGEDYDWSGYERRLRHKIEAVFQALTPTLLVVWNGLTLPVTEFTRVARSNQIPVRYLERGLFPGTVFIDSKGTNAGATIAQKREFDPKFEALGQEVSTIFRTQYQPIVQQSSTSPQKPEWPPGKRRALFIEQLDHDTNIVLFTPHYATNELAIEFFRRELDSQEWAILVKEHPEATNPRGRSQDTTDLVSYQVPLVELIQSSDLVLTRNSTVGLEALIFDRPVRSLGASLYQYFDAGNPLVLMRSPEERQQLFYQFLGEVFSKHHIITNPEKAEGYPSTHGYQEFLEPPSEESVLESKAQGLPYWRWPAVKSLQRMQWSGRLLMRRLKRRKGL